jgi:excinuclease UvrABC helicase subunit UvrB
VVGNIQETEDALNEWFTLNKPTNMIVDPDGDLSQQEWDELRAFLVRSGAETLVQHYDYVLVEHPPR